MQRRPALAVALATATVTLAGSGLAPALAARKPYAFPRRPKRLTVKVSPHRAAGPPYQFTVSGSLILPKGLTRRQGCKGTVTIVMKHNSVKVSSGAGRLSTKCRYLGTGSFSAAELPGQGTVTFTVRFDGNRKLRPLTAKPVKARYG